MFKSGITRRLIASILLVVLTSLALLGIYLLHYFYQNTLERLQSSLIRNARIIEITLKNDLYYKNTNLNNIAEKISNDTSLRITIIDESGNVLADTSEPAGDLDNHLARSEVQAALKSGKNDAIGTAIRYSQTLHENLLYVAIPIYENGRLAGVIRTSTSLAPAESAYWDIVRVILAALAIAFVAAIAMAIWLARRQEKRLRHITKDALAIAHGDLNRRLTLKTHDEFDLLSHTINKLTSNLAAKIRESQAETHKLTLILEHMDNAVMLIDSCGHIVDVNNRAQKLFDINLNDLNRHSIHVIGNAILSETALRVMKTEKAQTITLRVPPRTFEIYLSSCLDNDKQMAVAVFYDISLLQDIHERQMAFTGNAAHELATPLTAISGFAEMLREDDFPQSDTSRHFADVIYNEAQRMNRLIKGLLTLSRLDSKSYRDSIPRTKVNCREIITQAAKHLQTLADNKAQKIVVHEPVTAPYILAAPDLIEQIIRNLTENAIKYTPTGGNIELACYNEKNTVIFTIKDNGIGIDAENLPRIFDRFYRVDKARARKSGGNGIGLSLVKFLTETFNGHISVTSEINKGTTFTLVFPQASN